MNKEVYGYGAVIAAAMLWGVGGTLSKTLFNQDVSPFLFVKIRMTLSFLLLTAGIFIYDKRLLVISRQDIFYFIRLGIFGMALSQLAYFYTVMITSIAIAIFLQYLAPVFIAIYEVVWEKFNLGWQRGRFVLMAVAGGVMVILDGSGIEKINLLGIFTGLVAAVGLAINTVYGRRSVRKYHPLTGVNYSIGVAALFCWLIMPQIPPLETMTSSLCYMFAFIAVFLTLIPYLLYFAGVRFLSPTNVGVTACLEPVVAVLSAYIVLGEVMGIFQVLGGAMVVTAIVCFSCLKKLRIEPQVLNER